MKRIELKRRDCGCRKIADVEDDKVEEFIEAHMETHELVDITEIENK